MKLPKISFTAILKIPLRLILAIFTIPISYMFIGALITLFEPELADNELFNFDNTANYEVVTESIRSFVYKYNITFMQNDYLCDPATLSLIIGGICYIASGGFKEAFYIYVNVCKLVFNFPLKDLKLGGVFVMLAIVIDLIVVVYGFYILLALAFPASLYASIRGICLDFSAKAELTL